MKDGVTYLAGCTDPDYEDAACPEKGDFSGMFPYPLITSVFNCHRSNLGRSRLLQWHLRSMGSL